MNNELLKKYASLIINIGVNVQTNQYIYINCPVEAVEFGHMLAEEAYIKGARSVTVKWVDPYLSKLSYMYSSDEALEYVENFLGETLNGVKKIRENQGDFMIDENHNIVF